MPEFQYQGPRVFIVALQKHVEDGERVNGPAELECNFGFTRVEKPAAKSKDKAGDE